MQEKLRNAEEHMAITVSTATLLSTDAALSGSAELKIITPLIPYDCVAPY